jgi:hypothetical protein
MKLLKMLDQEANTLVSDPFNQAILKELVTKEQSISDLAEKLQMPNLKLWRNPKTPKSRPRRTGWRRKSWQPRKETLPLNRNMVRSSPIF